MEGDSNPIGVNDNTPKSDSPLDPFVTVRGLAFLQIEATSDQSSDDDTKFDTEEDEPTFFTGDTLFILEDVDPDTENCKFVLCPMTPYSAEDSLNIEDSSRSINGDLVPHHSLSCRFRCHTSNVDHHYCMWHGSKYCCRAPEPNWDLKGTIEKELYDDCLNYLECSDVMTDYANGIWLSALLGNESVFLLETDQDDETKVSQNECDVLPSGVTCVNEGSNNTLAMDDLASLCVSHSKAPAVDEKGHLSGDLLKALETEMVITVGHQQDNTSSPRKKEKCKLPCASAAIQDDQAGIEVENSPEEDRSASMERSNSNPFMELYLVTMTDEPGPDPLICDCSEEREQEVEKLIWEEEMIDKESPGIHTEEGVHQLSEGEIQDQFTLESTKLHDSGQSQMQEEQLMEAEECSDFAEEHVDIKCLCTIESAEEDHTKEGYRIKEDDLIKEDNHTKEDDHTKLIQFLKANIRPTKPSSELKVIENPEQEQGEDIQELEGTQKHPVESENQDGNHSLEKNGEYIQENYDFENKKSPVSGLLVSLKNSETNEVVRIASKIVGLEKVNGELQTVDSEPKILESVSQIVDSTLQVVNNDLHLHRTSSDGNIGTKFTENITDNLEVCKQGHEHETSNINGKESEKSYNQTMDNCAKKTNDLVDQPPRENTDSDSQSMETCSINPNYFADQLPRENSESGNQIMGHCALSTNDLVDQPPGANAESDNKTMANCAIIIDDLVGQPQTENDESDNQTMDNCAIKTDDLVVQPPRQNTDSDRKSMENCALNPDDLADKPPKENSESDNQIMAHCALSTNDLVDQPPGANAESDNKTMANCVIIDNLVGQRQRENYESDSQTMDNCAIKTDDLVVQQLRENTDSERKSMENCALNPDDLADKPPRKNSESDNQTMAHCALNTDDLLDQPPTANAEINKKPMVNYVIKINDLVGQPPRENAESDNQTTDSYVLKTADLVGQPPREKDESDNQTMNNCAIKNDDLVRQPPRENAESENQTTDSYVLKTDNLVGQPPREKDESNNQTMNNCAIKIDDLVDKPPGENNTMGIPKVSNYTNVCLEPTEGSSSLMADNSPSTDDNLRTKSVQNISGKQMKRNASIHQEVKMHSKKKAFEKFPLQSFCAAISKGHHDKINNVVVENYQGGIAERHLSCFGENGEMPSLVKTKDGMCYNSTEIEKAHSLHVKDNIPNSQEPSQVCRDPDTIRGAELVRAQSVDLDQARGASCSLYFIGSPSLCETGTDSKMVKKKFKSAGKEPIKNTENEAQALDVNEGCQPEEEKRLKRQSSIDTAVSKDSKKAPKILHGIQAEMFPDHSGNLKLFCHFGDIHADSTITWTKDSKLLARMHRSPKDDSPVSLAIVQTSKKDQGMYLCTLKNMHGKVTTEFLLTSEVLEQLTRYQDLEGGEEVEFNQLFFREDFITDMYFGGNLHGRITTEDLHFGEGVHRKAFRSKVMCGLLPVFNPGHLCVLKVHNAIAYGTKTNDELVQKNYKLAVQECHVQNTAREYAKIYAAEAEQLDEFGAVPEIIPIFLIHRPANNIPYATVEEELIGDFVKYSVKDGKEINVLRRDSEAGQKCCTFQHWVYERTNGNLLVTDLQGVGMKLTDVGIATISKGYKGFKGNCSLSFIDQFKALHQCNKYCEILSLQPLRPVNPKQKKTAPTKEKAQPVPTTSRKSRSCIKPKNKT